MKNKCDWIAAYDSAHCKMCAIKAICNVANPNEHDCETLEILISHTLELSSDAIRDMEKLSDCLSR
jgi:hypothetical protein